ncbi:uncharacterized protein MYCFIDRAFT_209085 [Pseudocercospora fijiensis CIRAD86]|uniref:Uncharacterized protein n=1 Tax=Pseudocercospora fijiensis (strain CIRAD86) TaxID=383855 RepID=M2ZIC2_PSEFD|nr:uncharacterized protein MYCFIDRAFT_209085 [Pseudocercospora fijiensis CIRAD86]EME78854.1 hypothetical protein MYCFIDRAFT_209085 [Pseudocercospora fijiensis CIRAD86]
MTQDSRPLLSEGCGSRVVHSTVWCGTWVYTHATALPFTETALLATHRLRRPPPTEPTCWALSILSQVKSSSVFSAAKSSVSAVNGSNFITHDRRFGMTFMLSLLAGSWWWAVQASRWPLVIFNQTQCACKSNSSNRTFSLSLSCMLINHLRAAALIEQEKTCGRCGLASKLGRLPICILVQMKLPPTTTHSVSAHPSISNANGSRPKQSTAGMMWIVWANHAPEKSASLLPSPPGHQSRYISLGKKNLRLL